MPLEPELDELYREIILDHYRSPRNHAPLAHADVSEEGLNPLCGDEIALQLAFNDDRIAAIGWGGRGCSISQAAASMMSEAVLGRTAAEAEALRAAFEAMMSSGAEPDSELGDLEVLQGVNKFPVRIKCALLAWKVLAQALAARAGHSSRQPRQVERSR